MTYCPICLATTEQIDLWDANLYCVDCLSKKYPEICHHRKTNDTLYSKKTNWKYHPWRIVWSQSERKEVLIEYFSSPKNGLFLAFILASLCAFLGMFAEFEEAKKMLVLVATIWIGLFVFTLSWFVYNNLFLWLLGKKSLFRWLSDSSLKIGLFVTFVIASLCALPFMLLGMFPEIEEDEDMLIFAAFVWLAVFLIGFACFVWGNLFIKERKSLFGIAWVSDSPLISVKQGTVTITYLKYGFFTTFVKVPFQVPARFKMLTDDSNMITDLDKKSILLDVTDVYEHLEKIPGQYFAREDNANRFYLNCNIDASLIAVWEQFILL
jgi:hypothetical protein